MKDYFVNLNTFSSSKIIREMYEYAKENDVPIISDEGLVYLLQLIRLSKAKKILEIGTAIGYSSIAMALLDESIHIETIERVPESYALAINNIKNANLEERIKVICEDGLLLDLNKLSGNYDLIFIDAAKAQYKNFFQKYEKLLNKDGLIVCDNLLFHGLVELSKEEKEKVITSKNLKGLVRKIEDFNLWLSENKEYHTDFLRVGDGMSVSKRV